MGASLREYRRRISSVQTTKKITKAMELIASSRVVKAQQRVQGALPYTEALLRAIGLAAANTSVSHPLTSEAAQQERAAVLLITSDRGFAGAYNANVIREAQALTNLLTEQGKEVRPFIVGRKGLAYYRFRNRETAGEWTGFSESPTYDDAKKIADSLLESFLEPTGEGGVDEIHIVYTHFYSLARQTVRVRRVLPLEIVDQPLGEGSLEQAAEPGTAPAETAGQDTGTTPLYDFEPSPEAVLDALLPRYVENVVHSVLLLAAASEQAARMRAMSSASDNAEDIIRSLTRAANSARQGEITQEISEIVGGADALAAATAGSE
jgi:F-type H+-transporting ATPase subunit gamma